jgi:hypothetical protein
VIEPATRKYGDNIVFVGAHVTMCGTGKSGVIEAERVADQDPRIKLRSFDAGSAKRGREFAARRVNRTHAGTHGIRGRHQFIPSAASNSA